MAKDKPSRTDNLEIHTLTDGYVVYDKVSDRVHYLNQTASLILELCNGAHDQHEISKLVQDAFDLDRPPVDETQQTLRQFSEEGLIQ